MPWYKYACFWKENLFCKPQGVRQIIIAVFTHIYGVFTTRIANPYCKVVKLEFFMCDKHIRTLCWQTEVILVITVKKYSAQCIKVFVWSFPNHLLTLHLLFKCMNIMKLMLHARSPTYTHWLYDALPTTTENWNVRKSLFYTVKVMANNFIHV